MYIIKNTSGALSIAGLYPGEAKEVSDKEITEDILKLYNKALVSITYVKDKKKEITIKNNNMKDEVEK